MTHPLFVVMIDLIITAIVVTAATVTTVTIIRRWIMRARQIHTAEYWRMYARACEARVLDRADHR